MLYSENQMIDLIRKAGIIQMKDDWLGIGDPFGRMGMSSALQTAQIHPENPELDMTDEEKRHRKACPNNPLKQHLSRYLTEVEETDCNVLENRPKGRFKWQIEKMPPETKEGIDTEEFKKQCKEIDDEPSDLPAL